MKSTRSIALFAIIGLFSISKLFGQNVIIDYYAWNPSAQCDMFNTNTNVPATSNGSATTIQHATLLGDVGYSSSDRSLQLANNYINGTTIKGTKFRLQYNFKAGYRYQIFVTSAASHTSSSPYLRIDLENNGSVGGSVCQGAENITANLSGNPAPNQYSTTNFQDVQFVFGNPLPSSFSSLVLTSMPAQSAGASNTIRIRKIEILETAPTPTFTITNPININCGNPNTVNLTVTNVYNSPGVTGYTWNLGTNNNWNYNGSPAPSSIFTATNSITLTSNCGITPSNVSATVTASGSNFPTNSGAVSVAQPNLSISGPTILCTSSVYSVNNLPQCGATVSGWSATPSGIVQITDNGNNTATVTKVSNGQFTLSANVSISSSNCNSGTTQLSLAVSSGAALGGYYTITSNYHSSGTQYPLYNSNSPIWLPANQLFEVSVHLNSPGLQSATWTRSSSSYPFTWNTAGTVMHFSGLSGSTAYAERNGVFGLSAVTACGNLSGTYSWPVIVQGWGSFLITASPNPTSDFLNVNISKESFEVKSLSKNENVLIEIYSFKQGRLLKKWLYKNDRNDYKLDVSDLREGQYVLVVKKGKFKETTQIIIK